MSFDYQIPNMFNRISGKFYEKDGEYYFDIDNGFLCEYNCFAIWVDKESERYLKLIVRDFCEKPPRKSKDGFFEVSAWDLYAIRKDPKINVLKCLLKIDGFDISRISELDRKIKGLCLNCGRKSSYPHIRGDNYICAESDYVLPGAGDEISIDEAAKFLKISLRDIKKLMKNYEIFHGEFLGISYFFKSDLRYYLDSKNAIEGHS